jgi:hypothetical protein
MVGLQPEVGCRYQAGRLGRGAFAEIMAELAAVPLSDTDHRAQLRRAVVASTVGTTIEWYDFLLYGQMAPLVFAKLYFPSSEPLTGACRRSLFSRSASSRGQSAPRCRRMRADL